MFHWQELGLGLRGRRLKRLAVNTRGKLLVRRNLLNRFTRRHW